MLPWDGFGLTAQSGEHPNSLRVSGIKRTFPNHSSVSYDLVSRHFV